MDRMRCGERGEVLCARHELVRRHTAASRVRRWKDLGSFQGRTRETISVFCVVHLFALYSSSIILFVSPCGASRAERQLTPCGQRDTAAHFRADA